MIIYHQGIFHMKVNLELLFCLEGENSKHFLKWYLTSEYFVNLI